MRIAIIGAGNVGGTLGRRWAALGHTVRFGVRRPDDAAVQAIVAGSGGRASAHPVAEAVRGAEVVLLATPWPATEDALRAAGDLSGVVLLDATNPILPNLAGLALGHETSGAEQVARWAPGTRVVKIFSTTGSANMADPAYAAGPVTMLYCGDDAAAKAVAATLAAELGFAPQDLGPLSAARYLEPFAMVWITLAYKQGLGPGFALNIVRR